LEYEEKCLTNKSSGWLTAPADLSRWDRDNVKQVVKSDYPERPDKQRGGAHGTGTIEE
jgi:hypothetical protein